MQKCIVVSMMQHGLFLYKSDILHCFSSVSTTIFRSIPYIITLHRDKQYADWGGIHKKLIEDYKRGYPLKKKDKEYNNTRLQKMKINKEQWRTLYTTFQKKGREYLNRNKLSSTVGCKKTFQILFECVRPGLICYIERKGIPNMGERRNGRSEENVV